MRALSNLIRTVAPIATRVRLRAGRAFGFAAFVLVAGLPVRPVAADEVREVVQPVVSVDETFAQSANRPVTSQMRPAQIHRRGGAGVIPDLSPAPAGGPESSAGASASASAAPGGPLIGETFQRFDGPTQANSLPPDPHLAVGPSHVVAATNDEIVVYSKAGNRLFSQSWEAFFQEVDQQNTLDLIFDPKVVYDTDANRFFVLIVGGEGNPPAINGSRYLIAVTQTSDPTGVWRKFNSESTANNSWSDYPGLAVDGSSLYVTANYFSGTTGQYNFAGLRVYPKAQFLSSTNPPTQLNFIDNLNVTEPGQGAGDAFTIQPAVSQDNSDVTWFSSVPIFTSNERDIFLYSLDGLDAPRTIRKFTITLPPERAYTSPFLAIQPGGIPVDALDGRIVSAHKTGTKLYVTHTVAGTGTADTEVRWYEFNLTNPNAPTLTQTGTISALNGSALNPAIAANALGDVVVTFSRCNRGSEFLSMFYAARSNFDPIGAMPTVRQVDTGNATYQGFRWGDYAGAAVDPTDGSTIWAINELPGSAFNWRTTIARIPLSSGGGGGTGGSVCPAELNLLSPNGGENWTKGVDQEIRWDGSGTELPDVLVNVMVARYNPNTQLSEVIGFLRNGAGVTFPAASGRAVWNVDDPLIINPAGNLNDPANQVDVSGALYTSGQFADYQIVVQTAFLCPPGSGDRLKDASTNFFRISNPLSVEVTSSDSVIERGESVTLAATPAGGKPPYTFRWTPSETLDNPNIFRPVATPLGGTRSNCDADLECKTYTVEVTDSTGPVPLTATADIIVRIADPLVVNAGPSKAFLLGSTVLLEGSATGGGKPYTYLWNPIPDPTQPPGANGQNIPQPLARPTADTVYTLTVTDRFGNVKSSTVQALRGFSVVVTNQPVNGGIINRNPVKSLYVPGEQITFSATPASGFQFLRWEIGPVGQTPSQFSEQTVPIAMPAADLAVRAVYSVSGSGSARPNDGTDPGTNPGVGAGSCGMGAASGLVSLSAMFVARKVVRRRRRG